MSERCIPIDFVQVDPSKKTSASAKSRIRSHARAETHAKARRKRVEAFHKEQNDKQQDQSEETALMPLGEPLLDRFGSRMPPDDRRLLDHYLQAPEVYPQLPWLRFCTVARDKAFRSTLVQIAHANADTMKAILLVACRSLYYYKNEARDFDVLALRYKSAAMRGLAQRVAGGKDAVGMADVVTATCLALDDTTQKDWAAAAAHVLGVVRLMNATTGIRRKYTQEQLCEADHFEWLLHKIICSTNLSLDPRFLVEAEKAQFQEMDFLSAFMWNHRDYVKVMTEPQVIPVPQAIAV